MRSSLEIAGELSGLIQRHYYSEAPDLAWAVKSYAEQLGPGERDLLKRIVLQRLMDEPSIVNVVLVSCWNLPESVPILISILQSESVTSMLSRMVMSALHVYSDDGAYRAIERFVDSEQEGEALTFLARMDFARTVPRLKRAIKKDSLLDVCLHILHERKKTVGLPALIEELKAWLVPDSEMLRRRLGKVLSAKDGKYNPFAAEDRQAIHFALNLP